MSTAHDSIRQGCKAWRQARLAALCCQARIDEQAAGLSARGSSKRMADRLGLAPTALSNMVHGAKNIGDEAARSIEISLGLHPGSLDAPPLSLVCLSREEHDAMVLALANYRQAVKADA